MEYSWHIHGVFTEYSRGIHMYRLCVGYVSVMCRLCVGTSCVRGGWLKLKGGAGGSTGGWIKTGLLKSFVSDWASGELCRKIGCILQSLFGKFNF